MEDSIEASVPLTSRQPYNKIIYFIVTDKIFMRFFLILILFSVILFSCATKKEIEYRDRNIIEYVTRQTTDTIIEYNTDSIYVEKEVIGDTVLVTKYKFVARWHDRILAQTDTIYKDKYITEYKEIIKEKKIIPKWCYFCLFACSLFIFVAIKKILSWLKII